MGFDIHRLSFERCVALQGVHVGVEFVAFLIYWLRNARMMRGVRLKNERNKRLYLIDAVRAVRGQFVQKSSEDDPGIRDSQGQKEEYKTQFVRFPLAFCLHPFFFVALVTMPHFTNKSGFKNTSSATS